MKRLTRIKRQLQESVWCLGICEQGFDSLQSGDIHWIDNGIYKGKWFADPFILCYDDDTITLLVEEFDYKIHRGRLAQIIVSRKHWTVTDCKIILDINTHVSFPLIHEEDGIIYVCPENHASGKLIAYRYDKDTAHLSPVQPLINEPLTDSIVYIAKDCYWLLSTKVPTPNGHEMDIYKSGKFLGKYEKSQTIDFGENIARNAGKIFYYQGRLVRPAQECNHVYGHSIVFQEMKVENGHFCFSEIYRYSSTHPIFRYGTHTYNQYHGIAVIDVKGFRYRLIGKWLWKLQRTAIRLHLKKEIWLK